MIQNGFEIVNERLCTEISSLPDQNLMKQRFLRVGGLFSQPSSATCVPDSIPILACKALEDYMKNLMENVSTMKFGREPLLRPPISYIFPDEIDANNSLERGEVGEITETDLSLLFKLKPWLLADMEADLST